jgi:hypothetical protein
MFVLFTAGGWGVVSMFAIRWYVPAVVMSQPVNVATPDDS